MAAIERLRAGRRRGGVRLDRLRPARGRRQLAGAALRPALLRLQPAQTTCPRRAWITRYWLAKSRNYAAACANTAAKRALLRAPDHARHRARHGADPAGARASSTISFYGYSYGSYLGQVYATRFPSRVGRFVLDGVVEPAAGSGTPPTSTRTAPSTATSNVFCPLPGQPPRAPSTSGKRWRAIKRGYYRELRRLDRQPAAGGRLGPDELADAMLDAGYYVYDWVDHRPGLLRRWSGSHRGASARRALPRRQLGDDNGFAMYNAVQCSDAPWPGWSTHPRDAAGRCTARAPFLTWGNTWFNAPVPDLAGARRTAGWPCPGAGVTAKMLLISETRDAATPYSGALRRPPAVPLGLAGRRRRRHDPRELAVRRAVRRQHRRQLPAHRRRADAGSAGNRADRRLPAAAAARSPYDVGGRVSPALGSDRMSPLLRQDLRRRPAAHGAERRSGREGPQPDRRLGRAQPVEGVVGQPASRRR